VNTVRVRIGESLDQISGAVRTIVVHDEKVE
jgi:hypothetical protein